MSTQPSSALSSRIAGWCLLLGVTAACAHQEQGELPAGRKTNAVNGGGGGGGGGGGSKGGSTSSGGSFSSSGGTGASGGAGTAGVSAGGAAGVAQGGGGGSAGSSAAGTGGGAGDPVYVELEGFTVEYKAVNTTEQGPYISAELAIVNDGALTVPLSELAIRYYFTNENPNELTVMLNWGNMDTPYTDLVGAVTSTVVEMEAPTLDADRYIEFTFSGSATVAPGAIAKISWQMGAGNGMGTFVQTDDWSFDVTKTAQAEWDHVVLMRNGDFAWGTPP